MTPWVIGLLIATVVAVALARARRSADAPPPASLPASDGTDTSAVLREPGPESKADTANAPSPLDALQIRAQTLHALGELAFGTALAPSATNLPQGDQLCEEVAATLARIVEKPNYAPRRPMQLPRLMQAINDETASRGALSQIIAGDPALAGNLLRIANSPFYRHGSEPIESLDRAVSMLGIEGLRSMIAAALLQPVFRISGGSFAHFGEITWEHSLLAANAAELHAAQVESADPFAAQLLGLLLGLAHIVCFTVSRDAFLGHGRSPDAGLISALVDAHSPGVARQIAASWELSERIDAALADQGPQPATALGRSLRFGEYVGALAVLRQHNALDDAAALAGLQFAGVHHHTAERVWARLGFMPD